MKTKALGRILFSSLIVMNLSIHVTSVLFCHILSQCCQCCIDHEILTRVHQYISVTKISTNTEICLFNGYFNILWYSVFNIMLHYLCFIFKQFILSAYFVRMIGVFLLLVILWFICFKIQFLSWAGKRLYSTCKTF